MHILKNELNDVISLFKFYLENRVMKQPIKKLSYQIKDVKPQYVINFNYTDTYKQYNIDRKDVCFVHGSVMDNNMVFGIKDANEEDIYTIYFKKYFQRIQKHTDLIDWKRFMYEEETKTYFFGHSLSYTDGDIIRKIYKFSDKIIIFYMLENNDYEKKIINLIDTLGKNEAMKGLYDQKIIFIPIE